MKILQEICLKTNELTKSVLLLFFQFLFAISKKNPDPPFVGVEQSVEENLGKVKKRRNKERSFFAPITTSSMAVAVPFVVRNVAINVPSTVLKWSFL